MVKQLTQTNSLDLNIFTLLQRLNKAVKKTRKKKHFVMFWITMFHYFNWGHLFQKSVKYFEIFRNVNLEEAFYSLTAFKRLFLVDISG